MGSTDDVCIGTNGSLKSKENHCCIFHPNSNARIEKKEETERSSLSDSLSDTQRRAFINKR
jgi:hypothetical protein